MSGRGRMARFGLAVVALAALAACQPAEQGAGASAGSLQPGEHEWVTADGNRMPYEVTGEGEVTVVLVHCWMCDRTFWSEQVPVLAERYRTITLDLPGHGEATGNREEWRVGGYGEDVAGLIEGLDLPDVVLVGHSMGGPVSLRAAALAPGRVLGIVAVDTLHDAEFEFSGEQVDAFLAAFQEDFAATCGAFVQQMFPEEDAGAIMTRVRETSCGEQRKAIALALMQDFGTIDMPRWMTDAGVPIRAINAAGPNPTKTEVNRQYADFDAVLLEDAGHYLQMTRPGRFNPLLLEAIAGIRQEEKGSQTEPGAPAT